MKSTIATALVILLCGVGAGAVANTAFYKLKWVKDKPAEENTIATTQESSTVDTTNNVVEACVPKPDDKPNSISKECVLHYLENGGAFIVDAREENDFVAGHLKGAIHLAASEAFVKYQVILEAGAQVDSTIIVYCGGGECEASHNVADALRTYDHKKVLIYENGWKEIESTPAFSNYLSTGSEN